MEKQSIYDINNIKAEKNLNWKKLFIKFEY